MCCVLRCWHRDRPLPRSRGIRRSRRRSSRRQQLDGMVERIALYPDPLVAQVLTGSTFWNGIPDAAAWANQHSYLRADELSRAMYEDNLSFDPSVLALIPFPSVLDMMARDPGWSQALGNAVLSQRPDVMDAVQRMRQKAMDPVLFVGAGITFRAWDLCGGVRAVRLGRSGAGMAHARDRHRSSPLGPHVGEPRQTRALVRGARGAAGRPACRTSRAAQGSALIY